jgi:hypothetical protein
MLGNTDSDSSFCSDLSIDDRHLTIAVTGTVRENAGDFDAGSAK